MQTLDRRRVVGVDGFYRLNVEERHGPTVHISCDGQMEPGENGRGDIEDGGDAIRCVSDDTVAAREDDTVSCRGLPVGSGANRVGRRAVESVVGDDHDQILATVAFDQQSDQGVGVAVETTQGSGSRLDLLGRWA